jgi:hypothetical protein
MGSMDVALCYDDLLAAAATGRSRRLLCRAKALGLTVPQSILLLAIEVIE